MEMPPVLATFVVRLGRDATGRLGGVVERVRTGQKTRFRGGEDFDTTHREEESSDA